MSTATAPALRDALDRLCSSTQPLLIGVRHCSPAMAVAAPALLERFAPDRVFIELPVELQPWLAWLGRPELEAPVALAAARGDGGLSFYPLADFSPELAALRWAHTHQVPVEAFDRSLALREPACCSADEQQSTPGLDTEVFWDREVEARAVGADPEQVRRAALAVGWSLRAHAAAAGGVPLSDLLRERAMREALRRSTVQRSGCSRPAVVAGAFHCAALLAEPLLYSQPEDVGEAPEQPPGEIVTSLIAYAHDLLDSRSGYPAGIRDPMWQHRMWQAAGDALAVEQAVVEVIVQITREMRGHGHAAGFADALEGARMALDLARLRGLAAPARAELIEAVQTTLGQGELYGRGRVLARAAEAVLVGRRRGRLAPGTPRSGLAPHVECLLAELGLPGPAEAGAAERRLRIDPIRSRLDRRREVALERLATCHVPYASPLESTAAGDLETLTRTWLVAWRPATEAMLEMAGVRGVTLRQAAEGSLRAERARLEAEERLTPRSEVLLVERACAAGLTGLAAEGLEHLAGPFTTAAGLAEIVLAMTLIEKVRHGHIPGVPGEPDEAVPGEIDLLRLPPSVEPMRLLLAAADAVEGVAGSEELGDVLALLELVSLARRFGESAPGRQRLLWSIRQLARHGGDLMQGAANALLVGLGLASGAAFGELLGSWVDGAVDADSRSALRHRLRGALVAAGPVFEVDPSFCGSLIDRVDALDDQAFLARLPALRGGFEVLPPQARERLLVVLAEHLGDTDPRGLDMRLEHDPELLALTAAMDGAGSAAMAAAGLDLSCLAPGEPQVEPGQEAAPRRPRHDHALSAADRWRLILGRQRQRLAGTAARAARALDELYGYGGEVCYQGQGGGDEAPFPSAREWGEELQALFGAQVREEVLGQASAAGRAGAVLALDPQQVRPSVELLEQVLSLKGGVSEAHLGRLRQLVERVVQGLVQQLAVRIRPALTGIQTPRPTRRRGGRVDLDRTIRANLATVREHEGRVQLVPEKTIYRSRGARQMDWHVVLVVDVSGSMEPSTIYSALMAAILAGVPWVSVSFLAFSTEVIDLSGMVSDPLGLLLEVSVGGGTDIARALAAARAVVRVPARTIVLLVTDFEEGASVGRLLGEVRALKDAGVAPLGLAALDDLGAPRYNRAIAELVVGAGMPVAALTPLELAAWVGERMR